MFWLTDRDRVFLVRRPAKGLLGGMRALPTGPWADAPPGVEAAPVTADWRFEADKVEHGFTHFALVCALAGARFDGQTDPGEGEWWPVAELDSAGLPTVFAKAATLMKERWRCD